MELNKMIDKIKTKEDLAEFVRCLRKELETDKKNWKTDRNYDLSDYLEALAGWVEDMDKYYKNTKQDIEAQPKWKIFADILMAAAIYE
jgi:hypothetical protein